MKIFLIIILTICIVGCTSDKNPLMGFDNSVLKPLAIGNRWEYLLTFSSPDTSFERTIVEEINDKITINYDGNVADVYLSQEFYPYSTFVKTMLRNEVDGLYRFGALTENDTLISKTLLFKYPTNIGDSWFMHNFRIHLDGTISIADSVQIECYANDEKFETLIGNYDCHVYHYQIISVFGKTLSLLNKITDYPENLLSIIEPDDSTYILDIFLYYKPGIGRVGAFIT
ncbi:MAG: hypothetical protein ACW99Q_05965 [Candidatus Kariarchaeaceae archaeon]